MDQVKIGKFIAELRKERNLTQKELAEKIGVTDRAVSKWENGRGMPDVSFLGIICETLNISLNELLSGERIKEEDKIIKLEENYISVIDSKTKLQNDVAGYLILKLVSFVLLFISFGFFSENAIWLNAFITFGFIFMLISSYKLVKSWNIIPKIVYLLVIFILAFGIYKFIEFRYIDDRKLSYPHFYYQKKEKNNCVFYKTIGYNCLKLKSEDSGNKNKSICYIIDIEDMQSALGLNSIEEILNSDYCNFQK